MAAPTSTSLHRDPIVQFSVFAENRVGRLYDLTSLLAAHGVHIMAVTTLDSTDSTIVRMIVDDPDKARELFVNNDFSYTECDILGVEISDESQLKSVLAALLEAEINIHYIYSFVTRPGGRSALALSIEDKDLAEHALHHRDFRVLGQRDISR